ncbi:hypothetical protein D3C79_849670 [compost metagenome]
MQYYILNREQDKLATAALELANLHLLSALQGPKMAPLASTRGGTDPAPYQRSTGLFRSPGSALGSGDTSGALGRLFSAWGRPAEYVRCKKRNPQVNASQLSNLGPLRGQARSPRDSAFSELSANPVEAGLLAKGCKAAPVML